MMCVGRHSVRKMYSVVETCIKLGDYNIGFNNGKLTVPYYMAFLIVG